MRDGFPDTSELCDRADRACEEAKQLLAVRAISADFIERSYELINRSEGLLKTTRPIGTRAGKNP